VRSIASAIACETTSASDHPASPGAAGSPAPGDLEAARIDATIAENSWGIVCARSQRHECGNHLSSRPARTALPTPQRPQTRPLRIRSVRPRAGESDLDFLVEFEPLESGVYADAYFGLLESLEALFARPVDLVVASSIKNPYFRQGVERTKVLLYAA
jgi:predicted nucleotidyltransferase